ncbi:glycosyltransferase family 2 protein [Thermaerobacter sp. PB12/4term]|uniref:glycosyltransferase family 2 protein n=1 Tax=Thermaerobacter sp. PB12/4term TaxID=2293838 RepID=UPI000E328957|nr:glycosyltransferase family 2 protein [Thermaerobacter sp. PB12/4term]QIA26473.1 glycosyltransferase family 2 protein [Thermaerobacter sp. PB12/4term]
MTYLDPAATVIGTPAWPLWLLRGLEAAVVFVVVYNLAVYLGGLRNPRPVPRTAPRARFAVLIPAHNEEAVIGPLIESLWRQEYPRHLYDVFVIADNCTDGTAAAARAAGARVWQRFDDRRRGKQYAVAYALERIASLGRRYDAVVMFDADNLVQPNFLQVMNDHLAAGEKIIQAYVDAKNPDDSWVAAAFAFSFWMSNRWRLQARHNWGLCGALAGTGMCIAWEVLERVGWDVNTLTEDLEFSAKALLHGYVTTFARETRIYDEKVTGFVASCRQRVRWARGNVQVMLIHAPRLLWAGLRQLDPVKFEFVFDLTRPLHLVVTAVASLLNLVAGPALAQWGWVPLPEWPVRLTALFALVGPLLVLVLDRLPLRPYRFIPLLPLFQYSWIALVLWALLTPRNRQWVPTVHTRAVRLGELSR